MQYNHTAAQSVQVLPHKERKNISQFGILCISNVLSAAWWKQGMHVHMAITGTAWIGTETVFAVQS